MQSDREICFIIFWRYAVQLSDPRMLFVPFVPMFTLDHVPQTITHVDKQTGRKK